MNHWIPDDFTFEDDEMMNIFQFYNRITETGKIFNTYRRLPLHLHPRLHLLFMEKDFLCWLEKGFKI